MSSKRSLFTGEEKVVEEEVEEEKVEVEKVQEEKVEEGVGIWDASKSGDLDRVKYLLETKHIDVDSADRGGWTALMWASGKGHRDMVECLVEHNADIDKADNGGWTALLRASYNGQRDMVECLVEHNADIDKADPVGRTALLWASYNGNRDMVECLVEHKAVVEKADNDGRTALDCAFQYNSSDIIELLLPIVPPATILRSAKKYPSLVYKYTSELQPEECASTTLDDSHLLYEGEKVFRECSDDDSDNYLNQSRVESLYNSHPLLVRMRVMLASARIPDYGVTEYKIPLNEPTHTVMLKACLFVSLSQSNPKLFDKNTVIGDAVEAAWLQYGRGNHLVLSLLYLLYLGLTTLLNYTFHDWIKREDFFIASLSLMSVIAFLTWFFVGLELIQMREHYREKTLFSYLSDVQNILDWLAYTFVQIGFLLRMLYLSETNLSASLMAVGTVLLWLKLTHFLRPFELTGPLVRMIFAIVLKIKELLAILAIINFTFAQALYLLSYASKDLEFSDPLAGIMQSFVLMMGQIDLAQLHETSNPKLAQFLLVSFVLVSTILILNLLIALMISTYTEIAQNAVGEWNRERAMIITEQYYFYTPQIKKHQFYLARDDDLEKRAELAKRRNVDLRDVKEISAELDKLKAAIEAANQKAEAANQRAEDTNLRVEAAVEAANLRVEAALAELMKTVVANK